MNWSNRAAIDILNFCIKQYHKISVLEMPLLQTRFHLLWNVVVTATLEVVLVGFVSMGTGLLLPIYYPLLALLHFVCLVALGYPRFAYLGHLCWRYSLILGILRDFFYLQSVCLCLHLVDIWLVTFLHIGPSPLLKRWLIPYLVEFESRLQLFFGCKSLLLKGRVIDFGRTFILLTESFQFLVADEVSILYYAVSLSLAQFWLLIFLGNDGFVEDDGPDLTIGWIWSQLEDVPNRTISASGGIIIGKYFLWILWLMLLRELTDYLFVLESIGIEFCFKRALPVSEVVEPSGLGLHYFRKSIILNSFQYQ